jgi:hypothetical protein
MPNPVGRPRKTARLVDPLAEPAQPGPTNPVPAEPEPVEPASPLDLPPRPDRPLPDSALTPEQLRIRELENQLALERGRKDPELEFEPLADADAPSDLIFIHFIADGLSVLGKIWTRGEELRFDPRSRAYADTCDRNGRSWLEVRDDPVAQERRWGEVKFRSGPWPGDTLLAVANQHFDYGEGPTHEQLRAAHAAEQRRAGAPPRLPLR